MTDPEVKLSHSCKTDARKEVKKVKEQSKVKPTAIQVKGKIIEVKQIKQKPKRTGVGPYKESLDDISQVIPCKSSQRKVQQIKVRAMMIKVILAKVRSNVN